MRRFRTTQPLPLIFLALVASCQDSEESRNNPLDAGGGNWAPPTVSITNKQDTLFVDSSRVHLIAHGASANSKIARYRWDLNETILDSVTDSVWHPRTGLPEGTYAVRVWAVDANGLVSLKSDSIRFRVYDQPPVLATVRDTSLLTGQSWSVTLDASDLDGTVTQYLFDTAGGHWDSSAAKPTLCLTSTNPGSRKILWKARDDLGKVTLDSFTVSFLADQPVPVPVRDSALSASATLSVQLTAHPLSGGSAVAMYRWSVDGGTTWDSSATGGLSLSNGNGGTKTVLWNARNTAGNLSASNTFVVSFVPAPTIASLQIDSLLGDWTGTTGTVKANWSGSVPGFAGEGVTWTLRFGLAGALETVYQGTGVSWSKPGIDSGKTYQYELVGRNRFGDSVYVSRNVLTKFHVVPVASDSIPWNASIEYGILSDIRDNQSYYTVKIGSQTWMAQNLNYRQTLGTNDTFGISMSLKKGATAGRYYSWTEAMQLPKGFESIQWTGALPRQGICPAGWHIPSALEWSQISSLDLLAATKDIISSHDSLVANGNSIDTIKIIVTVPGRKDPYGFRSMLLFEHPSCAINCVPMFAKYWEAEWKAATSIGAGVFASIRCVKD